MTALKFIFVQYLLLEHILNCFCNWLFRKKG